MACCQTRLLTYKSIKNSDLQNKEFMLHFFERPPYMYFLYLAIILGMVAILIVQVGQEK